MGQALSFASSARRGGIRSRDKGAFPCRAHGVVVSRLLRMQKALGSNPSGSSIEAYVSKCRKLAERGFDPPTFEL